MSEYTTITFLSVMNVVWLLLLRYANALNPVDYPDLDPISQHSRIKRAEDAVAPMTTDWWTGLTAQKEFIFDRTFVTKAQAVQVCEKRSAKLVTFGSIEDVNELVKSDEWRQKTFNPGMFWTGMEVLSDDATKTSTPYDIRENGIVVGQNTNSDGDSFENWSAVVAPYLEKGSIKGPGDKACIRMDQNGLWYTCDCDAAWMPVVCERPFVIREESPEKEEVVS